jgi:hypothetical protein
MARCDLRQAQVARAPAHDGERVMPPSGHPIIRFYRFYFLDATDSVAKAHDIESPSDKVACELAALMLVEQTRFPSIEVWEGVRKVCRHPWPAVTV